MYATRYGSGALREEAYRERIIRNFTSGSYLWMWFIRSSIEAWYDKAAAAIEEKLRVWKSLKERFQEKLQGSRWTGSTNNIGYPKMKVDGEMVLGSHVALRLAGRKAPTGGPAGGNIVMHKDNNKLNLSPSNLEVGTHKENLKQMRDEGRDRPRGVHQEPDEKTARVRGPVKAMRRAMELLQDGSTATTLARLQTSPELPRTSS